MDTTGEKREELTGSCGNPGFAQGMPDSYLQGKSKWVMFHNTPLKLCHRDLPPFSWQNTCHSSHIIKLQESPEHCETTDISFLWKKYIPGSSFEGYSYEAAVRSCQNTKDQLFLVFKTPLQLAWVSADVLWLSRQDLLVSQRVPFAKKFMAQVMKERYLQVSVAIYIHFGFGQILIILRIMHRVLSKCTAISAGLFILAGSVCCVVAVCHPQVASVFCTCYSGFPKSLGWCVSSRLAQGRIPFLTDFCCSWFLHHSHLPLVCRQGKAKLILQMHFCSAVYRRQIEVTLLLSYIMDCLLIKKKWWEKVVWSCRVLTKEHTKSHLFLSFQLQWKLLARERYLQSARFGFSSHWFPCLGSQ